MITSLYRPEWIVRFFARVKQRDDSQCWEWSGTVDSNGYGRVGYGKKAVLYCHRVAKELSIGRTLIGSVHVCHSCDNPRCCNPSHLFLGDQRINTADMHSKGRNVNPPPQCGERNVNAKLTSEEVSAIRKKRLEGIRPSILAKDFGVSYQTIWRVLKGKAWAHV